MENFFNSSFDDLFSGSGDGSLRAQIACIFIAFALCLAFTDQVTLQNKIVLGILEAVSGSIIYWYLQYTKGSSPSKNAEHIFLTFCLTLSGALTLFIVETSTLFS